MHVRRGGSAIILPLLSMSLRYKWLPEGEVAACDEPCEWLVRVGLGHMANSQHLEEVDRVPGRLISKEDGSQPSSVFVPGSTRQSSLVTRGFIKGKLSPGGVIRMGWEGFLEEMASGVTLREAGVGW